MNKKLVSKVVSALLIIIVLASQIIVPASVSAESQKIASFTLTVDDSDSTINRGDTFTVIFAVGSGFSEVNGFNFSVSYNTSQLTYEKDSLTFYSGTVSDVTVNASGGVNIAWDSAKPVSLADGQKLFRLRFRVGNSVATGTQSTISVKLNSMYSSSVNGGVVSYTPFTFGTIVPSATVVIGAQKSPVDIVTDLINSIGTVTLDDACKAKIDEAANAFYSLTLSNRTSVKNSAVLFAAIDQYQKLLDESTNIYAGQIAEFRETHAAILGTAVSDLTLDDKDAVVAAYNALVAMPLPAQARLYSERTHLMSLLTRIAELTVGDGDDPGDDGGDTPSGPTDAELAEAAAIISEFDKANGSSFKQFLSDGTEYLNVDAAGPMIEAYEALFTNAMAEPGSKLEAFMIEELEKLYGEGVDDTVNYIYEYLVRITDPNLVNANKYKAQFGKVLSMDPEELQYSDRTDIMIAAAVLEWLDDGTLAFLQSPDSDYGDRAVYDIVMELLEAVLLISDEEGENIFDFEDIEDIEDLDAFLNELFGDLFDDLLQPDDTPADSSPAETIIQEIIKTITKTVTKTNTRTKTNTKLIYKTAAGNYLVKLANRDIGAVVWVLLCLTALSSIIFVVLRIVYHNVSKVKKEEI